MQNDENTQVAAPAEEATEVVETAEAEGQPEIDKDAEILKLRAIIARKNRQAERTLPTKKEIVDDISPIKDSVYRLELAEKKRQFGYEHGLSPEETDAVFKLNPKPTKDDLNNPFVKGGLEAIRAQKRISENTPSPSNSAPKFSGKTFQELPEEDKKQNWGEFIKAKAKK